MTKNHIFFSDFSQYFLVCLFLNILIHIFIYQHIKKCATEVTHRKTQLHTATQTFLHYHMTRKSIQKGSIHSCKTVIKSTARRSEPLLFYLSLIHFVGLFRLGGICHYPPKSNDRDNVGDYHKVVEHIRKLPNQIVGEDGAEKYEFDGDNRVDDRCFFAEEIVEIDLAEKIPTDDGGECKEEQTDRNEDASDLFAEY